MAGNDTLTALAEHLAGSRAQVRGEKASTCANCITHGYFDIDLDDLAFAALRRYLDAQPKMARLAEVARPPRAWGALSAALRNASCTGCRSRITATVWSSRAECY